MSDTRDDVWRKVQVKLLLDTGEERLDPKPFMNVFHDWVKHQSLGELLIDVVDDSHVHQGPSVVLVGHGSDYTIDLADGEPGLLCTRKRELPGAEAERLEDALRRALAACRELSEDARLDPPPRFRTDRIVFRALDRLSAPNDAESFERHAPALRALLSRVVGEGRSELERDVREARSPLTVTATIAEPPDFAILLEALAA